MKRIISLTVIGCIMLSLIGCGKPAVPAASESSLSVAAEDETTLPETAAENETAVPEDTAKNETAGMEGYTKNYSLETIRDEICGADALVALDDGSLVTAINFDNAATTPALKAVNDEVVEKLATYAYVGQGKGQKSAFVTSFFEGARETVLDFVNADPELYTAFFCSNTTDGLNKLSSALVTDEDDMVLTSRMEHYANDLPWRNRGNTIYAEVDENGRLLLDEMERMLEEYPVKYVSITAASNVTGYINDVHTLARMAHEHGALIVVDGAQIVPHRAFSVMGDTPEENIDFFVFSAHKMYAPYGGGAVVGLKSELDAHIPRFYGAGIVEEVTDESEKYLSSPSLYEAGSLNYTGVVAMCKAIDILETIGYDKIEAQEQAYLRKIIDGLQTIDGVTVYGDTENISDKIGIVAFNIEGVPYTEVAATLANTAGIDVGKGTFGSQPYVFRLLGLPNTDDVEEESADMPGMVRISMGIYNTEEEIDILLDTVRNIAEK